MGKVIIIWFGILSHIYMFLRGDDDHISAPPAEYSSAHELF